MIEDDVVDFTYKRNKLWQNLKKSDLKKFFIELAPTTIVIRDKDKIKAAAVYVIRNGVPVFVSLTIDKKKDGYRLIREFLRKNPKIKWLNKGLEMRKCLQ